jgi:hypothetical protein
MKEGTFTKVTVTQDGTVTGVGYLEATDISVPLVNYNGTINSSTLNTTTLNATGTATANILNVNNTGSSQVNIGSSNAYGGAGYAGLITLTNKTAGATNPNKHIRTNSTGTLEIVNNAYDYVIFQLSDSGTLTLPKGADGGLTLRPWTNDGSYVSLATANMAGAEYMMLSDGTNTFVSAGSGGSTSIRGGANSTTAEVVVTTSQVNINGNSNTTGTATVQGNVDCANVVTAITSAAAGRGMLIRQPAGDGSNAILQFTNNGVTAQRASVAANSSSQLILSSTNAFWNAIYNTTLAGTANIQSSSDFQLRRTTSSAKYKKNIESLDHDVADKVLELRPVWFRAKEPNVDNKEEWSYVGLIAEEVAEVEPRLVFYKTVEPEVDKDGNLQTDEEGKPKFEVLETPIPESVQYDKITVYLLDVVKREKARSNDLEQRIIALENLVASLV